MTNYRLHTRSFALLLGAALVVGAGFTPSASAAKKASCARAEHRGGDWPSMSHDLRNTRTQEKEKYITPGRAATLATAWTFATPAEDGSSFSGTPVVANGCVYVGSQSGWVYAVNADTGELVWSKLVEDDPEVAFSSGGAGINGSLAVDNGLVYASVSHYESPYVAALDPKDGDVVWATTTEKQTGAGTQSSPTVFNDLVLVGWDTAGIEFDGEARKTSAGGFAVIDALSGKMLKHTYTIPEKDRKKGYSGGNIWSTFAVDAKTKHAYVGTAATYSPAYEHELTNAIIKVDVDRASPTFGEIVDSYKGVPDNYFEATTDAPCVPLVPGSNFAEGAGSCHKYDLDFAGAPNIMTIKGKTIVGELQKAGVYHIVDTNGMKGLHQVMLGNMAAGFAPGNIGTTAVDKNSIYAVSGSANTMYAMDQATADYNWLSETVDAPIDANPVSTANGVVYTTNGSGLLTAHDARTGVLLLTTQVTGGIGSGVSIARNTVYTAGGGTITALRTDETREAQADAWAQFLSTVPTPPRTPHQDKPV
jgi:outer membrane protein assembly factor BamB